MKADTNLSKALIDEETRNSPREVFSGAALRALPNSVSRSILSLALIQMHDNGLNYDSLGQVFVAGLGFERQSTEWNLLIRVLIGVKAVILGWFVTWPATAACAL